MKITLSLHREAPTSPVAATNTANSIADAGAFLAEAVERIARGIAPGEVREVGVTIRIEAPNNA